MVVGRLLTKILCVVLCCAFAWSAFAIVIRHDKDETKYRELASEFPAAVTLKPDGAGVLIDPSWVLTAAHVAKYIAYESPKVEIAGKTIGVTEVLIHPKWNRMPHDVALLKLAEPVKDVAPALLYSADDEVGKTVTFVGNGDFGTGLTGPKTMDKTRRAATNVVDRADEQWIYFDFDQGDEATELEGVSGPGDSGGPALAVVDGKLYTLGVSVFANGDDGPGRYGVIEGYTRISTHRQWIIDAMAGEAEVVRITP